MDCLRRCGTEARAELPRDAPAVPATGDDHRGRHRRAAHCRRGSSCRPSAIWRRDADQSRDGGQRLPRAGVPRPGPRLRRTRHLRVRAARRCERAVRLARQDRRDRAPGERHDRPRSGASRRRSAPHFAGRRRAGARLFSRPGVSARDESRCSPGTPTRRGVTDRPKVCRASAPRWRPGSAAIPSTSSSWPARNRASICWRAASSIRATRSSIDRPGYLGAIQTFRGAGARVVGWDFTRADMDELEELLLRYRPKLIYTNPTHQNPTGVTLPIRMRREMLELAARYRVPIVEDDTYRELALTTPLSAVAVRPRRGAHRRHSHQQLLEDAGPGSAPGLDQRGAADCRSAGADQAAERSSHAEPVAAGGRAS